MKIDPRFIYRPDVLIRAILRKIRRRPDDAVVRTSWGDRLHIWPKRHIGGHIYMRGCHEIHVCEALWRLTDRGETVVDVGGNIGQMTCLLAGLVGPNGCVHSFEAHPGVFEILDENVKLNALDNVSIFNLAATSEARVLFLSTGEQISMNEGTASVLDSADYGSDAPAKISGVTLDSCFPIEEIGLLKIDVEGHEVEVLRGASEILRSKRVRDIAYEWRDFDDDEPHTLLGGFGYQIFSLSHNWRGLVVEPFLPSQSDRGVAVDFLATIDPGRVTERLRTKGWRCLSSRRQKMESTV